MRVRSLYPSSALPFAPARGAEPGAVTLPLRGFRQVRSYSCGYASALMVVRYFGSNVTGPELFQKLGTDRSGTRQTALVRVLRELGLRVSLRYDMTFDDFTRAVDRNKLMIGYLHDAEHWLVIYGYGRGPSRLFVADPRPQMECVYPWSEYAERLAGFAMVCSRPTPLSLPAAPADRGGQLTFRFGRKLGPVVGRSRRASIAD